MVMIAHKMVGLLVAELLKPSIHLQVPLIPYSCFFLVTLPRCLQNMILNQRDGFKMASVRQDISGFQSGLTPKKADSLSHHVTGNTNYEKGSWTNRLLKRFQTRLGSLSQKFYSYFAAKVGFFVLLNFKWCKCTSEAGFKSNLGVIRH